MHSSSQPQLARSSIDAAGRAGANKPLKKRRGLSKHFASKAQSFVSMDMVLRSSFGESALALEKRPASFTGSRPDSAVLSCSAAEQPAHGCSCSASLRHTCSSLISAEPLIQLDDQRSPDSEMCGYQRSLSPLAGGSHDVRMYDDLLTALRSALHIST